MRVLVTGSSGYIGPALVQALMDDGHHVVGVDRLRPDGVEPHQFIHGDLLEERSLIEAFEHDIDMVAHLAAARVDWGLSDDGYIRDNVEVTERLIEAGAEAGVAKWVFFSSVGVFGPSVEPLGDDAALAPDGIYGRTKAHSEELFAELSKHQPDCEITIIRPSAVYSPGNPDNTNVYRLIDALHRRRFVMIGSGENAKTISYLPNLIEATMFLIGRMSPGVSRYVYVDEPTLTTQELVDHLAESLEIGSPRWRLPLSLARPLAMPFDLLARAFGRDLPITSARVKKFCRPTNYHRGALEAEGFQPSADIFAGLDATVEWYRRTRAEMPTPEKAPVSIDRDVASEA